MREKNKEDRKKVQSGEKIREGERRRTETPDHLCPQPLNPGYTTAASLPVYNTATSSLKPNTT